MSWWSDGEPFDEWDPPYCKNCKRENLTKAKCDRCVKMHEEVETEDDDEE